MKSDLLPGECVCLGELFTEGDIKNCVPLPIVLAQNLLSVPSTRLQEYNNLAGCIFLILRLACENSLQLTSLSVGYRTDLRCHFPSSL